MNILSWILHIVGLLPLIASSVNAVKSDVTLGSKTQAAADALQAAGNISIGLLPAEHQATATAILQTAQTALASTVAAIHNSSAPAPTAAVVG